MSSFRGLKWVLLSVFIAISLGWKLSLRPGAFESSSGKDFQVRIAQFLNRQLFVATITDRFEEGTPTIRATAGACRILVARSPAIGWDRELILQHASNDDEVFIVYRGKIFREQPTFSTALDYLWSRLRRELGISSQYHPVIAVVAQKRCDAARLPWGEVS